jgi:hypothetical protein
MTPDSSLHARGMSKFGSPTRTVVVKNFFMLKLKCSRDLHTITRKLPNISATLSVLPFEDGRLDKPATEL